MAKNRVGHIRKVSYIDSVRQLRTLSVADAVEGAVRTLAVNAAFNVQKLRTGRSRALHDLRVTIRRIRTLLRAYEDYLPDALRAQRAELSVAMRQTNPLRDLEVHDALMAKLIARRRLPRTTRESLSTFRGALGGHHTVSALDDDAAATLFETCVASLLRALKIRDQDSGHASYSVTTMAIVQRETTGLIRLGDRILNKDHVKRLHRTRLVAKKIRYVLEPLPARISGVRDGITRLKRLQSLLGDIRDAQTLRKRLMTLTDLPESTSMRANSMIIPFVRAEEDRLFGLFLRRRDAGELSRLQHRLRRIAEELHRVSQPR